MDLFPKTIYIRGNLWLTMLGRPKSVGFVIFEPESAYDFGYFSVSNICVQLAFSIVSL